VFYFSEILGKTMINLEKNRKKTKIKGGIVKKGKWIVKKAFK
jgi:hypothetical protein